VHPGSALGGVQWGMSADDKQVYVANALRFPLPNAQIGGLSALTFAGEVAWNTSAPSNTCSWGRQGCSAAQSQAVSSMPGAVFSGSLDGYLRAYDSVSGKILWEYNTGVEHTAVNGNTATGGSLDGGGPVIANAALYILSGYGRLGGHGGNALIVFTVNGQ